MLLCRVRLNHRGLRDWLKAVSLTKDYVTETPLTGLNQTHRSLQLCIDETGLVDEGRQVLFFHNVQYGLVLKDDFVRYLLVARYLRSQVHKA